MMLAVPAWAGLGPATVSAAANGGATVEIADGGEAEGFSTFALAAPDRLVVDLRGASTATAGFSGTGLVAKVRAAQFDRDTARIVLDLAGPAKITASAIAGGKLRLTLAPTSEAAFAKMAAAGRSTLAPATDKGAIKVAAAPPPKPAPKPVVSASTPPAPKPQATQPAQAAPPRPRLAGRLPVVVIDAGHGGKDVGTISVLGPTKYEKDAVLAIARAIKKELDASGRVRTILTRGDDTYLRHRDRFEIARHNNASLFISVHADSAPVPNASGATVYTLSETASDAEAARLAAKENRSDIIAGVNLGVETSEVSDILIDLAQRETMNTSAEFAAILQRELRQDIKVRSQFHRFAGFLVLKAPDVPSVLLETGYMSNEEDAKFLFSASGQARIAKGVRRAVEAHFLRRLAQR